MPSTIALNCRYSPGGIVADSGLTTTPITVGGYSGGMVTVTAAVAGTEGALLKDALTVRLVDVSSAPTLSIPACIIVASEVLPSTVQMTS